MCCECEVAQSFNPLCAGGNQNVDLTAFKKGKAGKKGKGGKKVVCFFH